MIPGTRPARRAARAAPFPAFARGSALKVMISAIKLCSSQETKCRRHYEALSAEAISTGPSVAGAKLLRCARNHNTLPDSSSADAALSYGKRPVQCHPSRHFHELGQPLPDLVEQARDRPLLADPLDCLGHQRGDR